MVDAVGAGELVELSLGEFAEGAQEAAVARLRGEVVGNALAERLAIAGADRAHPHRGAVREPRREGHDAAVGVHWGTITRNDASRQGS